MASADAEGQIGFSSVPRQPAQGQKEYMKQQLSSVFAVLAEKLDYGSFSYEWDTEVCSLATF